MAATIQNIEFPTKPRALDSSGNNNHGKIYSGRALEFDGVSDSLTCVDLNDIFGIANTFTIACWFKVDNASSSINQSPWSLGSTGSNQIHLRVVSGNLQLISELSGGSAGTDLHCSIGLESQTWYRAVVVVNNLSPTIYVNGVAHVGSMALDSGLGNGADFPLTIGGISLTHGALFPGCICDFQVWDTALSADDITYDYANPESLALNASGTALTEGNLKLWYPMQDGHRGQQSYILDGANTGLGDEMVSNGDFSNGLTGWTLSGTAASATQELVDGKLSMYSGTASDNSNVMSRTPALNYSGVSGVTYRLKLDVSGFNGTSTKGTIRLNGVNEPSNQIQFSAGENTVYFRAHSDFTYFRFTAESHSDTYTVDNVSLKAINDKHHATTVFSGLEQISNVEDRTFASSIGNWTNAGGDNALDTFAVNSAQLQVAVTSDGSNVKYASLDEANWADADGDGPAMVAGRSYRLSFSLQLLYTSGTFSVGLANDSFSMSSAAQTFSSDPGSGAATYNVDFVYNATDHTKIMIHAATSTAIVVGLFDNFTIKELGAATGWTDADQQLDIAQTALQSYNEMAWFDGVDDRITCNNGFTPGDNTTVAFWVFLNGSDGESKGLFNCLSWESDNFRIAIDGSNRLATQIQSSGANTTYTDDRTIMTRGKWIHVCVIVPKASGATGTMYINGVGQNYTTSTTMAAASRDIHFLYGGGLTQPYTNGSITGVTIHNAALNASEVLEIYNNGKELDMTTFSGYSDVTGYWRNSGLSTWTDIKGSDDGTHSIAETLLCPQGVDGSRCSQGFIMNKVRNTSSLNMTNARTGIVDGYVDLGSTTTVADDAGASFVMWLKPDDVSTSNYFLSVDSDDHIQIKDSTSIWMVADGATQVDFTVPTIVAKEWMHVVITRKADDDTMRIYINGELEGTSSAYNEPFDFRFIGAFSPFHNTFRGQLDGFLYYDDQLTDAEVLKNYNATKGVHTN